MSHLVITIGCEYGAKGNQIGRKIAEDLGFQFYDRNIVDAIIHEVGIPGEIMEKVEEGVTIVGKGAEGELPAAAPAYNNHWFLSADKGSTGKPCSIPEGRNFRRTVRDI